MTIQDYKEIGALIVQLITILLIFWTKVRTGVGIKQLRQAFMRHTAKDDIKAKIHQRLEVVIIEKLKYVRSLDGKYKDMLTLWAEKFEDFAINAYFSEYRKGNDIEHYLNTKAGGLITDIELMILQSDKVKSNGLSDGFYKEIDLLVRALVKNGLNDEGFVDLFVDSVNRILDAGIDSFFSWDETKK